MMKLAVFDVDGTLRDRDFLPDSTREALQKLRSKGISLAICTGRSEFELASLREELGIEWAVTCNGSHIGYRGRTVDGRSFPRHFVRHWLQCAADQGHTLVLCGADTLYINDAEAPLFRLAQEDIGFREPVLLSSPEQVPDIYQCIAFLEKHEQDYYTSIAGGELYTHRWRPWAVDFNPPGVNKAAGLRRLLHRLNLKPEETVAFGDGLNDLEMMDLVGTAVVMGNGCQELKAKATFVTKSLHEEGIAFAVDYLEKEKLI